MSDNLASSLTEFIKSEREAAGFSFSDSVIVKLRVPAEYDSLTDEIWDEVAKNAKCGRIYTELDNGNLRITYMRRNTND